jgi:hypothetical protein
MKKTITILVALITFSISFSQDCNIGNEDPTGFWDHQGFSPDYLFASGYTLVQEGTLNSINIIGNNSGANFQMAVYDDNGGTPNNLIVESGIGVVGEGVISLPVTPTLLAPGLYWIAFIFNTEDDHLTGNTAVGHDVFYASLPFGNPLPANWTSGLFFSGSDFLVFLEISCTLGIEDNIAMNNLVIVPNPSSDFIEIVGLKESEIYTIYTILGAKVAEGYIQPDERININNLRNGMYFIQLGNGQTTSLLKN